MKKGKNHHQGRMKTQLNRKLLNIKQKKEVAQTTQ